MVHSPWNIAREAGRHTAFKGAEVAPPGSTYFRALGWMFQRLFGP